MFGNTFYYKTLRKNVSLFGTLFNDIHINRESASNTVLNTLKVPITYGPKEKTLTRVNEDPNLNRQYAITLPRMSFEMTGLTYDSARKLPTVGKGYARQASKGPDANNSINFLYNPVPYNINFSLYIMVKFAEDGTRILEQILPFFAPEWTASVNLIPEMGVTLDIPTIINNVSLFDSYEGSISENRIITWTLNFTMKTYLFGPVKRSSQVIKISNTSFFSSATNGNIDSVSFNPVLSSNGSSVPVTDIQANSNYTIDTNVRRC